MDNPPAWHPDPAGTHDHRWWDGQRWTEHVADAGVASIDPLPDAPPRPDDGATGAGTETGTGGPAAETGTGDHATEAGAGGPAAEPGSTPVWGAAPSDGTAPPSDTGSATGTGSGVWGGDTTGSQGSGTAWGQGSAAGSGAAGSGAPWAGAPTAGTSWDQQASWSGAGNATNGLAIGSLVTGILSLPLLLLFGLGTVLGIVAVVLGIVAIRRANRGNGAGRGLAIGGIVTGAISALLGVVVIIFFVSFGSGIVSEMEACLEETGGDEAECSRRLEDQLTDRFLND